MAGRSRLKSGATLLSANLADMVFPFLRNVALSHTLPTDQYGLAISLSVVAAFAELATDIGLQYSAVRGYGDTDPEEVYGTLHAVALLRSGVIALILLAAAPVVVASLDAWHALWAFLLLALVPLIRGFQNLGVKELTRSYEFGPDAATLIGAQVAWTLVSVLLALALRDYRCMLAGILGGAVTSVIVSQAAARRRWRLAWNREVAHEAERFGRPLIPNGMANAFSIMGDRLCVGSLLGVSVLALYNNAMGIALIPRGQLIKFLTSIYLPAFVTRTPAEAGRPRLHDQWAVWLSLAAFAYGLGLLALGRPMIGLVFGPGYTPSLALMSAIAIDVCIKTLLAFPVPPCLAAGQTGFVLRGSIASAAAVLLAALTIPLHRSLAGFVGGLAAGEVLALLWIVSRTLAAHAFSPRLAWFLVLFPIAALLAFLGVEFLGVEPIAESMPVLDWVALCTGYGAVVLVIYLLVLRSSGLTPGDLVRMGGGRPAPAGTPIEAT
ncbi:lipopolysaccharide biosynthesis protein [Methylobacterium nodulans]|uniref:Polysaccharide biosynthesis protein n=1 Tax=Methylobacterium nodulans (strain LMG 21967 / CNCM I-2342 / ORS 2060) TaxID=460265 RepID=B8ISR8_METNO|nr:oligosaccharide flippase family protein [Methylobacterium nodulans]ACL60717.1 polysaccharide biosynthesis protein [Methylobacterium nodulans ORS 2060]